MLEALSLLDDMLNLMLELEIDLLCRRWVLQLGLYVAHVVRLSDGAVEVEKSDQMHVGV
jgi:hypothetical protein